MTSVGYGDYYPTTDTGRIVGVLCALTGAFLQSLAVMSTLQSLCFSRSESISFHLLEGLRKKNKLMVRAVNMMSSLFRFKKIGRKSDLLKYTFSKWQFRKTSHNLRLQVLQTFTPGDYHRIYLKSVRQDMQKCKELISAISLYVKDHEDHTLNSSVASPV